MSDETAINPPSSSAATGSGAIPGAAPTPGGTAPAAPPAARIVVEGQRTEREVELQSELETERTRHAETSKAKKDRELKIAELEDELHRLKQPRPAEKKSAIEEFFES